MHSEGALAPARVEHTRPTKTGSDLVFDLVPLPFRRVYVCTHTNCWRRVRGSVLSPSPRCPTVEEYFFPLSPAPSDQSFVTTLEHQTPTAVDSPLIPILVYPTLLAWSHMELDFRRVHRVHGPDPSIPFERWNVGVLGIGYRAWHEGAESGDMNRRGKTCYTWCKNSPGPGWILGLGRDWGLSGPFFFMHRVRASETAPRRQTHGCIWRVLTSLAPPFCPPDWAHLSVNRGIQNGLRGAVKSSARI